MRIRALGECTIDLDQRCVQPSAPHLFALLLRLGAEPSRFVPRQVLIELLFAHSPSTASAAHSMRQLLYHATSKGAPLERTSTAVRLTADVVLDVDEFVGSQLGESPAAARVLDILPGYAPDISDAFSHWLETFRHEQETRVKHALLTAISTLRQRADWPVVELRAKQCLRIDPFNEQATLALAESLAHAGSKDQAVALLETYREEVESVDAAIAIPANLLRRRIQSASAPHAAFGRTRFVGRGEEIAHAHDRWQRSRAGHPELTLLRGERGSGKTRFLEEFQALVELSGGSRCVMVRHTDDDRFRPFALFGALVPILLRLPGAAGCDPELLPFLHRLTSAASADDEGLERGEASYINAGITRAVRDLIAALCTERSLVVLLDDVASLDEASLALLSQLMSSDADLRVHLVIACNNSDMRDALAPLATTSLHLAPLARHAAELLVEAARKPDARPLSRQALDWCLTTAAGNPAHLTLLAEQTDEKAWPPQTPPDLVVAVERRLTMLSSEGRRVLEACIVLSDHCDSLLLGDLLGLAPFTLINALHELEGGEFVTCSGDTIGIRSALVQERATLLASRSVMNLLHARSAKLLENRPPSAHSHWRIASHWRAAGQLQQARDTLTTSWRTSLRLGQPERAEASIREYLALTVEPADRIALYDDLIEVTQLGGQPHRTVAAIDERAVVQRATGLTDPRRESLAFDRLDATLADFSNPAFPENELLSFLRSPSLDIERRVGAAMRLMVSADVTVNAILANTIRSELADVVVAGQQARGHLRQALLIYHSVFGQKADAVALATEIFTEAREQPMSWQRMRAKLNASLAMQIAGDASATLRHLEDCYAEAKQAGYRQSLLFSASRLASFTLDDGDLATATMWASRARAHQAEGREGRVPADYLSVHLDLALLAGDLDEARAYITTMREGCPIYEAPRYRMSLLAYSMRLAHDSGQTICDSDIEEMLEWHKLAKSFSRHDDEMEALWTGLRSTGRAELASALLRDYLLVYRREARSCRFVLRQRTAADSVWGDVASLHP